jgi:20S proteasome alpha/beta subunit
LPQTGQRYFTCKSEPSALSTTAPRNAAAVTTANSIAVIEPKRNAIRAIRAAAERDTYSGNGYLVAKVDENGFEMLDNEKINEILEKI